VHTIQNGSPLSPHHCAKKGDPETERHTAHLVNTPSRLFVFIRGFCMVVL